MHTHSGCKYARLHPGLRIAIPKFNPSTLYPTPKITQHRNTIHVHARLRIKHAFTWLACIGEPH